MNVRTGTTAPDAVSVEWDAVGTSRYRVTYETDATNAAVPNGTEWCLVEALGVGETDSGILYGPPSAPPIPATNSSSVSLGLVAGVSTAGLVTAASAVALPTYTLTIRPNHYAGDDGAASNYRKVWIDHSSGNTNSAFPNTGSVIASPMSTDSRAVFRSWVWWFAHEVKIDSSWDFTQQGALGTTAPEGHTCSHDVGNTGHGGIGWGFGPPSASFQLDYKNGNLYQHIENANYAVFPNGWNPIAVPLTKGVWHSVLTELTLGRTDGSVPSAGHPYSGNGRVRTWLNGNTTPIDTGATNTLSRATNPDDGITYTQTLMDMYTSGFYTRQDSESFVDLTLSTTATRIGRTLADCLADRPVFIGARVSNIYDGSGANRGPSTYSTITSRTTADFQVPAGL